MQLIPYFPTSRVCDTYWEFVDQFMSRSLLELKKIKCFVSLAEQIEAKWHEELKQLVESNVATLNYLNFNDQLVFSHNDFNSTNVLLDPETLRITCLIDWEWAMMRHEDAVGWFRTWYEEYGNESEAKLLVERIEKKLNVKQSEHPAQ